MTYRLASILICSMSLFCSDVRADEDTILEQLETAKAEYDDEMDRVHASVMTSLETKLAAAKKAGSLEQVEKIQAEIDAFDNEDQLPTLVSTRQYKRELSKACKKMENAFVEARTAYVKVDKTDEAKVIQAQLEPVIDLSEDIC
jgi:hypothetical protein